MKHFVPFQPKKSRFGQKIGKNAREGGRGIIKSMEKEVVVDDDIKLKATSPNSAAEEYALLIDSRNTIAPWLKWIHSYDELSLEDGVKTRTRYQAEKLKQFENGTNFAYDIYYKGRLSGSIEVKNFSRDGRYCDMGYWLSKKYVGKGIMTRTVNALTQLTFEKLDVRRIVMNIAEDNFASRAVAERCGYKKVKTVRDYFSLDDGYHDCHVYSKLKGNNMMETEEKIKKSNSTKTTVRVGKFAIIGVILSVFNFLIYTLLARLIFKDNSWLWLDSAISYSVAAILAYILHSKITWKERPITRHGVIMFFIWNGVMVFVSLGLTWLFGKITPLYEFAYSISSAIHLPFDYAFVESTGIFGLTTVVAMVLNYIFYDKLVFGDKNKAKK